MTAHRSLRHAFTKPALGFPVVGLLGMAAFNAPAQETPGARSFAIVPSLSITQTYSDNRLLSSSDRQSELITQLSPGLHFSSNAGRIRGQLDYSLNGYFYARDSQSNNYQNLLNAKVKAEAIENFAFIDAAASISQQSISAFGTQSPDSALQTSNQSEVSTYSLSPHLRGSFAGLATYEARANYAVLRSGSFQSANSKTTGGSIDVSSERSSSGRLGWALDLTRESISYEQGRRTESDRANVSLNLSATPELVLSARGGRELNDIATLEKEGHKTWGASLDWRPSERTHFNATRDKRFFGSSHSVTFDYRTPRTVWKFSDTRDISSGSDAVTGSAQTAHDLLFSQFASLAPDPAQRELLVQAFLRNNGISAGTLVNGGFLTSAVSVQRHQDFSLAFTGIRTTVILMAFQSESTRLDSLAAASDDLSGGGVIKQRGGGVTVAYRLTPASSLTGNFVLLKSSASSNATLASDEKSLTLAWTGRLGPHASVSLSGRHVIFDSSTSPYHESALIAGLTFQF